MPTLDPPPRGQLGDILESIVPRVTAHFRRRHAEYGVHQDDLGAKGQFADIHRKTKKLRRYLWEGVAVPDGAEDIDTIAVELIGHLLLLLWHRGYHQSIYTTTQPSTWTGYEDNTDNR